MYIITQHNVVTETMFKQTYHTNVPVYKSYISTHCNCGRVSCFLQHPPIGCTDTTFARLLLLPAGLVFVLVFLTYVLIDPLSEKTHPLTSRQQRYNDHRRRREVSHGLY